MKPYYDHGGITIYHGDCREILPSLGTFDLLLTDPPYGIAAKTSNASSKRGHRPYDRRCRAVDLPPVAGDDAPFDATPLLALSQHAILWGGKQLR